MPLNNDPPSVWSVEPDGYPNGKWTIRNQYGCTALPNRGNYGAGFYRTSSRAKAEKDCAKLNRKEEAMKAKTAEIETAETKQAEPLTKVAFRFWYDGPGNRKSGEVVAIMPELPGDSDPYSCTCYVHTGQHGICNVHLAGQHSRPATAAEYEPLMAELRSLGYDMQIIKRINQQRYLNMRRAEIARMAGK